jgi:O-antigen/teichoic acid export membrane protein
VNVLLAVLLAPRYNHIGMACSVVATELFVTSAIYLLLRLRGLDPLTEERRV